MSRNLVDACTRLQAAVPQIQIAYARVHPGRELREIQVARTTEEQQAYYAQGRTAPGKRVTNCDGVAKLSMHQVQERHDETAAHAVDLGVFIDGNYEGVDGYYVDLPALAADNDLISGVGWHDIDHLQCEGG